MAGRKSSLVQVTSSLSSRLGGPTFVASQVGELLQEHFDHLTIVFGMIDIDINIGQFARVSTIFNNRYGFTLRIPNRTALFPLRNADILLIHGFYLYSTLFALLISRSTNIFLMPHGSLEKYQERRSMNKKKIFRYLLKKVLRGRTIKFIVATNKEVSGITKLYPRAKVFVVGLGVANPSIISNTPKKMDSRINLLSLSRIHNIKRIDISISAVSLLRDKGVDCILRIVGDGNLQLKHQLVEQVINLSLQHNVEFLGHQDLDQKNSTIEHSDILLLPSENENFAIAVGEAIVRGIPVIVSSNVAMHEFVNENKTGIVLETLDSCLLANCIVELYSDYEFYRNNCLNSAHKLSWEIVIKNWINVLKADGL